MSVTSDRRSGSGRRRRAGGLVVAAACAATAACGGPDRRFPAPERVEVFQPERLLARFPAEESGQLIERAAAVAVHGDEVVVLDGLGERVLRFGLAGEFRGAVGGPGRGPGELEGAAGLAVGAAGDIWVSMPPRLRIARFTPEGRLAGEVRTPYPATSFAVAGTQVVLVPAPDAAGVVVRVDPTSDTIHVTAGVELPDRFLGRPLDRLRFRGLLLAASGDALLLLHNGDPRRVSLWRAELDVAAERILGVAPVPLPAWLRELTAETGAPGGGGAGGRRFEAIPFKGLGAVGDEVWLTPELAHRVLGVGVGGTAGGEAGVRRAVVPSAREEHRGLLQALAIGDTLVALYATEVRVYALEPVGAERLAR